MQISVADKIVDFSPGRHSSLIQQVVEQFAPAFVAEPVVLYLGDTERKFRYVNESLLKSLGIYLDPHDKIPDVLLYSKKENIIYVVEVVVSRGPVSEDRISDIEEILFRRGRKVGVHYFSAFPNRKILKNVLHDIAWDTKVWLAEEPFGLIIFRRFDI